MAPADQQMLVRVITDAMCGADHKAMNVSPESECVKECIRKDKNVALFVAIGSGLDIPHFPPGPTIIGIDISAGMISKAAARADRTPVACTCFAPT